ncbi:MULTISPECIES: CueP family metal-binding protein [Clostridia]|uniref:CueP family metal-binding protein n=1 Tax=Clostridia TaxID=186801 RepID=UPI000EA04D32|nr:MULTISPECIES: CueP family metal-binding protein [Clostridia]NBJ68214.1 hypothetical protein [Roseburia sp. 1XD42-34]RKI81985.1 hypothetical protein D7V87_01820 [Clostridium sp. 1xD42-85]
MKIKSMIFIMLILLFALVACSNDDTESKNAEKNGNNTDIKQLVADYSTDKKEADSASITGKELIVSTDDGKEKTYELPEDEFFVSIAPFVDQTHPCTFHSLTGCQGEMVEKEFDVYIEDEDGKVIVDKKVKSLANGFIDLWVPRDKKYDITIEHDGKKVQSEFSTFAEDPTCLTNMQLT